MKKVLVRLYMVWCTVVFTVLMVMLFPFFILPFIFGERTGGIIAYFFIKVWATLFSLFTQIRYQFINREKIDRKQTYIYVCNHNSYLDTPGMVLALPGHFRPLGKVECFNKPSWVPTPAA